MQVGYKLQCWLGLLNILPLTKYGALICDKQCLSSQGILFLNFGWDQFGHPYCSTKLPPNDFDLFSHLKSFLLVKISKLIFNINNHVDRCLKTVVVKYKYISRHVDFVVVNSLCTSTGVLVITKQNLLSGRPNITLNTQRENRKEMHLGNSFT